MKIFEFRIILFLFILFILVSPNLIKINAYDDFLYGLIFVIFFLSIFKKLWKSLFAYSIFSLLLIFDMWMRVFHGAPINSQTIAVLYETNIKEMGDFFSAYGLALFSVVFIWGVIYFYGIFYAFKKSIEVPRLIRRISFFMILPFFVLIIFFEKFFDNSIEVNSFEYLQDTGVASWGSRWDKTYPFNVFVAFDYFNKQLSQLNSVRSRLIEKKAHSHQDHKNPPDVVVLVIGESASAKHWELFGYERNTNDFLKNEKSLIFFDDIVSISNATRTAVPGAISNTPIVRVDGSVDVDAEPSIVLAFKEVGYLTYWISNQAPLGFYDTTISVYANEAEHRRFLSLSNYSVDESYDEELLISLEKAMKKNEKLFVVLHLLGSHFDYIKRYPKSFNYFHSNDDFSNKMNDEYDNSIRYTDFVLKSVINIISERSKNSVMLYFSDHGVDSSFGECASENASRVSEAAFRVPLLIWMGEDYINKNLSLRESLLNNSKKSYTTHSVHDTLLDLAGIKLNNKSSNKSLINRGDDARFIYGTGDRMINFDEAVKNNKCNILN